MNLFAGHEIWGIFFNFTELKLKNVNKTHHQWCNRNFKRSYIIFFDRFFHWVGHLIVAAHSNTKFQKSARLIF